RATGRGRRAATAGGFEGTRRAGGRGPRTRSAREGARPLDGRPWRQDTDAVQPRKPSECLPRLGTCRDLAAVGQAEEGLRGFTVALGLQVGLAEALADHDVEAAALRPLDIEGGSLVLDRRDRRLLAEAPGLALSGPSDRKSVV